MPADPPKTDRLNSAASFTLCYNATMFIHDAHFIVNPVAVLVAIAAITFIATGIPLARHRRRG
jgi:hypothetical protein